MNPVSTDPLKLKTDDHEQAGLKILDRVRERVRTEEENRAKGLAVFSQFGSHDSHTNYNA